MVVVVAVADHSDTNEMIRTERRDTLLMVRKIRTTATRYQPRTMSPKSEKGLGCVALLPVSSVPLNLQLSPAYQMVLQTCNIIGSILVAIGVQVPGARVRQRTTRDMRHSFLTLVGSQFGSYWIHRTATTTLFHNVLKVILRTQNPIELASHTPTTF